MAHHHTIKTDRYDVSDLIEAQHQPGSRGRVLRNLLGLNRKRLMDEEEAKAQKQALVDILSIYDSYHRFTAANICQIHEIWLGGIYEWAGKISAGQFDERLLSFCRSRSDSCANG